MNKNKSFISINDNSKKSLPYERNLVKQSDSFQDLGSMRIEINNSPVRYKAQDSYNMLKSKLMLEKLKKL